MRRVLFAMIAPLLLVDALLTGWAFGRWILGCVGQRRMPQSSSMGGTGAANGPRPCVWPSSGRTRLACGTSFDVPIEAVTVYKTAQQRQRERVDQIVPDLRIAKLRRQI